LGTEYLRYQHLKSFFDKVETLEMQNEYLDQILAKQKPLASNFIAFSGHIMTKEDKNKQVQEFSICLNSIFEEIQLQTDLFDLQSNQLRLS
jgi:hypothetical protein